MNIEQALEVVDTIYDATDVEHVLAAEVRRLREELAEWKASSPQPLSSWQPIATAKNDKPYIVGWIDDNETERHDFDIMDDGVWRMHDDICEMVEACAPAGCITPNRTAPYTHCFSLPPLPEPAP